MSDFEDEDTPRIIESDFELRKLAMLEDLNDPVALLARVYQIWWNWADFHLHVISPHIDTISLPIVLAPEEIPGTDEIEFVYPIHDLGSKLSTSKGSDMLVAGKSMCKLYYTIEKMIYILVERLKSGGIDTQTEVQIAFGGHELAQRKAFESVINLSYNVVVTNFDPGDWGQFYLDNARRVADKGYGYPTETPRDNFRRPHGGGGPSGIKRS